MSEICEKEGVMEVGIIDFPGYGVDTNGDTWSYKKRMGGYHKLMTRDNTRGYLIAHFWHKGKVCSPKVHRLVAIAFIPNPNGWEEVNHIDGDKYNNHVSNLEWCTRLQNMHHHYHVLGNINPDGKDHYKSIPIEQISKDGKVVNVFESSGLAEKTTAIRSSNIWKVLHGKRKSAGGYKWREASHV